MSPVGTDEFFKELRDLVDLLRKSPDREDLVLRAQDRTEAAFARLSASIVEETGWSLGWWEEASVSSSEPDSRVDQASANNFDVAIYLRPLGGRQKKLLKRLAEELHHVTGESRPELRARGERELLSEYVHFMVSDIAERLDNSLDFEIKLGRRKS